ncbi:F-box/FBD/LRR-repeat protein At5g56420-like [Carex rostrata]
MVKDSNQIDHLSNLPDDLLHTIFSFLPAHIITRTSILSRRFYHLLKAFPPSAIINRDLPCPKCENFAAMAKGLILHRNPSNPLFSLHLEVSYCHQNASILSSLLVKVRALDCRNLTIKGSCFPNFLLLIPIIFTINSLRYLSLDCFLDPAICFPSEIALTCLRSLSLGLTMTDSAKLNKLLSELCSLEDLYLQISQTPPLSISSRKIRNLKLIIFSQVDNLSLSLPSLESLHLEIRYGLKISSNIHVKVPFLRKAVINLHNLHESNVRAVNGLLNCISHVEELSLHLKESMHEKYPIPILLKSGRDVPNFLKLKQLDVILCFHEHNFQAVTTMIHNCPVLKSLKLVHEIAEFTTKRKMIDWESKLPHNVDGNCWYAYFKNLDLEEDSKEFMKLLSKNVPRVGKMAWRSRLCHGTARHV